LPAAGGLERLGWWKVVAAANVAVTAPTEAKADQREQWLRADLTLVSDSFANLSGGHRAAFRQMGLIDAAIEGGASFLTEGAEARIDVQLVHGRSLSKDLVGDAQIVSNIDAPDGLRLFEAWLRIPFATRGYVKGGLVDLNGEFDVQDVGSLFLNSSHGIGPEFSQTGENGPSIFPTTSSAVVVGWQEDAWSARLGLFDAISGAPDRPGRTVIRFPGATGTLLVGEGDLRIAPEVEVQLGAWAYSSRFEPIASGAEPSGRWENRGAYAMAQASLGTIELVPARGWVRLGAAESRFNPISFYAGGGLSFETRSGTWGIALAHARLGSDALSAAPESERAETNVELTWRREWGRLAVQPDVQYVINPGWDKGVRNSLAVGVRLELKLL
jgi:porin